jgi:AraC family transcriptional regulator
VSYGANAELPLHSHRNRALLLPLRGAFVEETTDTAFRLCRGTALLRPPALEHSDRFESEGAQLLIVEPHEQWWAALGLSVGARAAAFEHPAVSMCSDEIVREMATPDSVSPLAIESALLRLFCGFARAGGSVNATWLEQLRKRLTGAWSQPVAFSALCREVGVHAGYAAQLFADRYGCSPAEYVRKLRLDFVCQRLERSRDSLAAIAAAAGFADQSHLSRTFRKAFGMTPRDFRRRAAD